MSIREIVSAILRRWYVLLAALACAGLLLIMLVQDGGIYSTRTVISFTLPATTVLSPENGTTNASVIAFAAAVVQEANRGRPPARYSMDDAPYYGAGIREGAVVALANEGNQWASNSNKAEVQIQIVGRTQNWVEVRQERLINEVLHIAESRQADLSIPPTSRIQASVVPLTTGIEYVSASRRGQVVAGAALFCAAFIVGAWGSVTLDRLLTRRRAGASTTEPSTFDRQLEGATS